MRITLNQDPEAVTEARENADLTKTALAKAVGRSLSLISEIEGGTRNAKPDLLESIAAVTGVPVAQLKAQDA
ncbi:helix-turn-helix domain-containing protein [Actinomadura luteofluorescens]|uniref:helix-turn-helix domain-containing protein n=1 Tax=Actinomadura luteofluorescens TaxID=46163 RepID=UPI00349A3584